MQIVNNTALLVSTNTPAAITSVVPHSALLGPATAPNEHNVLIKWDLESARLLRNMGFKQAPSPIRTQYNWPGRFTPFAHQITTAEFFTLHKRGFCLNQVGTGKTSSVLWAADYLMSQGVIRRMLVVAPLSILYTAWADEVFNTVIHRKVAVAHGTKEQRRKVIHSDAEIVIINHDGVKLMRDDLDKAGFDLIVGDEANAWKTSNTDRWKCMHSLIKPDTWVWLMTGTPAPQSPTDAYGVVKLIQPQNVPKYFTAWKESVMRKITTFKYIPRPNARELVFNAMQPAIRFEKKDCIDLPPLTYVTRDVAMTPQQQHYYTKLKNDARLVIGKGAAEINAVNAAAMMTKLLQLVAGSAKGDDDKVVQFDISARLAVIEEIIEQADGKVLIAVPYIQPLLRLQEELNKKYSVEVIYGDVSATKRADIIRRFQQTDTPEILIMQPNSVAHGITLTEADTIIWYSPTTSFEIYAQLNARIDRPGQKRKMTVFQLQSCDVEKKLNAALRTMMNQHIDLVELYNEVLV